MNTRRFIATAIFAAFAIPAFAQSTPPTPGTNTPRIDQRAVNQDGRIAEGQATGKLTSQEAANLEKRDAKLDADIAKAKSDGTVTAAERKKLTKEENRNSKKIAKKKHNEKTAPTVGSVEPAAK